jgi:hypothetical protein
MWQKEEETNMQQITLQDLTQLELKELKFCVESLGFYMEEEVQFIYDNLYRGNDGHVYYYTVDRNNKMLTALYVE